MARRRPSRSALVLRWLAVAVLAIIAVSYIPPLRSYRDAREEVERRADEVAKLRAKRADLKRRIEYARTDAFVEREARKLGLVRPGERLFIVKWKDD